MTQAGHVASRALATVVFLSLKLGHPLFLEGEAGVGKTEIARTLRASLRHGGEITRLAMNTPRPRWPNLVVLCDISGAMSLYSRLILHSVHAVG